MEELTPITRPLNQKEKRAIQRRIAFVKGSSQKKKLRLFLIGFMIFGILSVLTIVASNAHWIIIVAFFTVIGVGICFWLWYDDQMSNRELVHQLESVLQHGTVHEIRIHATNVVEFEEQEDEGACFAFEISSHELLFVCGQEFYQSAKFPNDDFSLIYIHDQANKLVELFVEKHGNKLKPARMIPADVKGKLKIPEHLERISGKLDDIERILAA